LPAPIAGGVAARFAGGRLAFCRGTGAARKLSLNAAAAASADALGSANGVISRARCGRSDPGGGLLEGSLGLASPLAAAAGGSLCRAASSAASMSMSRSSS
jgi:hypothetical protein